MNKNAYQPENKELAYAYDKDIVSNLKMKVSDRISKILIYQKDNAKDGLNQNKDNGYIMMNNKIIGDANEVTFEQLNVKDN